MIRFAAGFDPSIAAAGLGVIGRESSRYTLEHIETIRTDSAASLEDREAEIFKKVSRVLREYHPACLAIENQLRVAAAARGRQAATVAALRAGRAAPSKLGFNSHNDQTLEVVGVVKGCCLAYGIPIVMLEPQEGKIAVLGPGRGHAEKEDVRDALLRLLSGVTTEQRRASLNGWDAVSLAVEGERRTNFSSRRIG